MSQLPNIENRTVLPHAEPSEAAPKRDEDEMYELERQREIDAIRRTIKRFGYLSLAVRQAD